MDINYGYIENYLFLKIFTFIHYIFIHSLLNIFKRIVVEVSLSEIPGKIQEH